MAQSNYTSKEDISAPSASITTSSPTKSAVNSGFPTVQYPQRKPANTSSFIGTRQHTNPPPSANVDSRISISQQDLMMKPHTMIEPNSEKLVVIPDTCTEHYNNEAEKHDREIAYRIEEEERAARMMERVLKDEENELSKALVASSIPSIPSSPMRVDHSDVTKQSQLTEAPHSGDQLSEVSKDHTRKEWRKMKKQKKKELHTSERNSDVEMGRHARSQNSASLELESYASVETSKYTPDELKELMKTQIDMINMIEHPSCITFSLESLGYVDVRIATTGNSYKSIGVHFGDSLGQIEHLVEHICNILGIDLDTMKKLPALPDLNPSEGNGPSKTPGANQNSRQKYKREAFQEYLISKGMVSGRRFYFSSCELTDNHLLHINWCPTEELPSFFLQYCVQFTKYMIRDMKGKKATEDVIDEYCYGLIDIMKDRKDDLINWPKQNVSFRDSDLLFISYDGTKKVFRVLWRDTLEAPYVLLDNPEAYAACKFQLDEGVALTQAQIDEATQELIHASNEHMKNIKFASKMRVECGESMLSALADAEPIQIDNASDGKGLQNHVWTKEMKMAPRSYDPVVTKNFGQKQ